MVREFKENERSVIIWVGNLANYDSFKFIVESDTRFEKDEILIITDASSPCSVKLNHSNYSVEQWTEEWSDKLTEGVDYYMILNHDDPTSKDSKYKSENKMVTAICRFIMPVVSDTKAYQELATLLNAEFLIFNDKVKAYDVIEYLRNQKLGWRKDFYINSYKYIYKKYNKNFISKKVLRLMGAN